MKKLMEIYTDFLISSFSKIEIIKLSKVLNGIYSHFVDDL